MTEQTKPPEETISVSDFLGVEENEEEQEPILDLEELTPKRPAVMFRTEEQKKAGKAAVRYELRVPQEFDIEEEHIWRTELMEYSELMQKRDLTKAERAKLRARLNHLFEKILLAPPEIREKFRDRQKQQVIGLFTTALLREDAAALENALPTAPTTGN